MFWPRLSLSSTAILALFSAVPPLRRQKNKTTDQLPPWRYREEMGTCWWACGCNKIFRRLNHNNTPIFQLSKSHLSETILQRQTPFTIMYVWGPFRSSVRCSGIVATFGKSLPVCEEGAGLINYSILILENICSYFREDE